MPLVCPFWANYVKAVEICPAASGAEAYFLMTNWDGMTQIVPNLTHYSEYVGLAPVTGPDGGGNYFVTPYAGTPTDAWSVIYTGLSDWGEYIHHSAILVKVVGGIDAATVSWTFEKLSGSIAVDFEGTDTYLDNALLKFRFHAPYSEGVETLVFRLTPSGGGVPGTPLILRVKALSYGVT